MATQVEAVVTVAVVLVREMVPLIQVEVEAEAKPPLRQVARADRVMYVFVIFLTKCLVSSQEDLLLGCLPLLVEQ